MSYLIRHGSGAQRTTVLVNKNSQVIELRNGNKTFRSGFGRSWDSIEDWISSEGLDRNSIVYDRRQNELTLDSQKVIDIMAQYLRHPNMYKSKTAINGYKYKLDSYIYVYEDGRLIPFYIAADGTMLYKYTLGKTFESIELVDPEFWVKDRGNQVVRFVS